MKIEQIENLSAYFDGEISKSAEVTRILDSSEDARRALSNFKVIAAFIKQDSEKHLEQIETTINGFWPVLEKEINHQEEKLNELLKASLGELPTDLAEADVWAGLNKRIEEEAVAPQKAKNCSIDVLKLDHKESSNQFVSLRNWESVLKNSFALPNKLKDLDIWESIGSKLNKEFHVEIFSENASAELSDKDKFYLGLSEYFDGEVSAFKAQTINNHLLVCASCRGHYLSMVKLKNVLKFAVQPESIPSQSDFWNDLQTNLFPEEKTTGDFRKVEGL
jgi:hypothetical protein